MDDQQSRRKDLRKIRSAAKLSIGLMALFAVGQLCSGCAWLKKHAETQADRAAYEILQQKNGPTSFSISQGQDEATNQMLSQAGRLPLDQDTVTTPSYLITLSDALAIAVNNSRDYQSQKEQLYNQALSLTESRRNYNTLSDASAYYSGSRNEWGHGIPPAGATVDRFDNRGFGAGLRRMFAWGGRVSLDFTQSYVRNLTNGATSGSSTDLAFSVVQPFLNGAGPLVAYEGQRQAERSMVYTVRNFKRYQQSFIINVAQQYYDLLRSKDQLTNAEKNVESTTYNWNKMKRLAEGDRKTLLDVGNTNQNRLNAELRLIDEEISYLNQLDSYKQFLGLDLDLDIGPDPAELDALWVRGMIRPDMQMNEAIQIALGNRLDFLTVKEQTADSERAVKIAFRNFLPNLDFSYRYSVGDDDDKDRIKLDFENNSQSWGLDLGLPLDWIPRRNNYKRALLGLTQAERSERQAQDNLIIEVRNSWRQLERLRRNYEIQQESRTTAESQVRRVNLELEMGITDTRELIIANDDLLAINNSLTSSLVNYTIARLRFWNTIERLEIDEKGMWNENN